MQRLRLAADRAALLVVDIQSKLVPSIDPDLERQLERYVPVLLAIAERLDIPVVVSEQYPRGLGATLPEIADALPAGAHRYDKMTFSACGAPRFAELWDELGRDQWIVCGMETHICVFQTVRDLVDRGAAVHLVRDAVASRTVANRDVGLGLIERTGAAITSTEVVLFDLLGVAGTDEFKALSRLIR
jgi:nicotinamidase-related amidase